jgi:Bacterial regulatory protein, arsR family.
VNETTYWAGFMQADIDRELRLLPLVAARQKPPAGAQPGQVTEIHAATGVPGSSVSQQLAVLRGQGVVATERHGTTIIYRVADAELFDLLDAARRIFNAHLTESVGLLRLVEQEGASTRAR